MSLHLSLAGGWETLVNLSLFIRLSYVAGKQLCIYFLSFLSGRRVENSCEFKSLHSFEADGWGNSCDSLSLVIHLRQVVGKRLSI